MDPVTLKLIQLIITSIFGAAAIVFGFILFLRGVSGKSTIIVERKDMKGKITNASPGVFLTIAGILILYWSINRTVERSDKTSETTSTQSNVYEQWLANTQKINSGTDYGTLLNVLFPAGGFNENTIIPSHDFTLNELSDTLYGAKKYWKILAALNKDREYYSYDTVSANTIIKKGQLIEYMTPAKFEHTIQRETLLKVRGSDIKKVYERIMNYADTSKDVWNMGTLHNLEKSIKDDYEVSIAYQAYVLDDNYTLNELSLKYYQDKKFYKIIELFNAKELKKGIKPNEEIKKGTELMIPYVTP